MTDDAARRPGAPLTGPPDGAALRAALAQTRVNLALLAAVLVALLAAAGYLLFVADYREAVRPDRYTEALRKQFADDIDTVVADAEDVAAEAAPPVADAFYDQFKADAPAYARALDTQGDILADHLAASLEKRSQEKLRRTVERFRAILREELPEVTDPKAHDRVVADFERMLNDLARRYYADQVRAEVKETRAAWRAVPPAEASPGGPPLNDRLAAAVEDWVRARLTEERTATQNRPAGGKP